MKIGIDARMYGAKSTSGIGVYIKSLTDELFRIDQTNDYIMFMLEPAFSQFNPPHQRVKKIKVNARWYSWSEQLELPKILLKHQLDLVHFPHFNVPILYPRKFIVTIHDITPKFFPGPKVKKSIVHKIGYQLVFRTGLNRAQKIIAISQHTKKNLIKHFKTAPNKIEVTHLGFNQNFKTVTAGQKIKEFKNKYNITKPFIFYLGVWRDHKNLPGLIRAFDSLKSQYNLDYQLVLGGKPDPKYPEIRQAIDNSLNKTDIITPGFIPDKELALFYTAADLFILPSFAEGFGLVTLESMSCGTPVVGSDSTSLPEILQAAALYFNPNDEQNIAATINKVLTDKNLYNDLKNKGLTQIQKYSWQACAQKTLKIYQNI